MQSWPKTIQDFKKKRIKCFGWVLYACHLNKKQLVHGVCAVSLMRLTLDAKSPLSAVASGYTFNWSSNHAPATNKTIICPRVKVSQFNWQIQSSNINTVIFKPTDCLTCRYYFKSNNFSVRPSASLFWTSLTFRWKGTEETIFIIKEQTNVRCSDKTKLTATTWINPRQRS